jgi:hypothetical protein
LAVFIPNINQGKYFGGSAVICLKTKLLLVFENIELLPSPVQAD